MQAVPRLAHLSNRMQAVPPLGHTCLTPGTGNTPFGAPAAPVVQAPGIRLAPRTVHRTKCSGKEMGPYEALDDPAGASRCCDPFATA
jgi:hypothetical protein